MTIPLRTAEEIEKLRVACKLASDVLVMIEPYVKAGVTTGGWIAFVTIIWSTNKKQFRLV